MSFVSNLTIRALFSETPILGFPLNQFDDGLYADFNSNATHNNYNTEEMKSARQRNRSKLLNTDVEDDSKNKDDDNSKINDDNFDEE